MHGPYGALNILKVIQHLMVPVIVIKVGCSWSIASFFVELTPLFFFSYETV